MKFLRWNIGRKYVIKVKKSFSFFLFGLRDFVVFLSELYGTHLCVSYKVGNGNIAIHFWHGVEYIPLDILCFYNPVTHYQL